MYISCKYKCKFEGRNCNSNQKWNTDKYRSECKSPKEHNSIKKIIFGILLHVFVKMVII